MRRSCFHATLCLAALTINCAANAAHADAAALLSVGTPEGFEELAIDRQILVDVYFGGSKVGETLATVKPGFLSFFAPESVVALVPAASSDPALLNALKAPLAVNAGRVCNTLEKRSCGSLSPEIAAIIYDEEHFRVDLFINPRFLATLGPGAKGYLPVPAGPVSLTSVVSVAAAGTLGERGGYNLQNRTIAGFRNGRIRTSNALASGLGWVVDDFVAEIDRRSMRYSAGLLWAPGDDFTGQRRILGGGFNTQFDTSADRELLEATPLVVFLSRPAQVELVVDGRLVGSSSYPAGNNEVDTSSLSDGSYLVTLRIHEDGAAAVREERRFFVKNARVAPLGRPIVYGYAGFLANTRNHRPVALSSSLYYRAGAAVRLDRQIAIDISAVGTGRRAISELGAWFLTPLATVRVAGLVSTRGDLGSLVQIGARNAGPFNFNLDVRRVWYPDGGPLIPLSPHVQSFDNEVLPSFQLATGSFTQVTGSIGLRLGAGSLSMIGTYRKDHAAKADYSIGPNLNWQIASRNGLQVIFQASTLRSRTTTAAFATVRILTTRGRFSFAGAVGQGFESNSRPDGGNESRAIGSLDAQYAFSGDGLNGLTGEAGFDRDLRSSSIRGGATYAGSWGNGRAEIRHQLEGRSRTRYDLNFQSGIAMNPDGFRFGARQTSESAIIVSLSGEKSDATYRVLLDDTDRGHLHVGERLSLFVPAYRSYRVRLLPKESTAAEVDPQPREVTLYPGNVATLNWRAERYVTLFARAISSAGQPIARALVQTGRNVAETDDQGYFQINVSRGDLLRFSRSGSALCSVSAPTFAPDEDLLSAGKVVCQ